jgi:23S rRNA pseudouridine1911/1915/1917 synthase
MPSKKKRVPRIPPGAPGHPRAEGDSPRPRAPRPDRSEREGLPARAPPAKSRARSPSGATGKASARLIYEDDEILAFDKPVGLPVIAPEGSRARCLLDIATEHVARKNPKGRAAVVHRIDRDTSGVVIFAADGRTKRVLMEGWDELVARRLYVALVEGSMDRMSGVFDSWLKENRAGEVYKVEAEEKGAKRAVTRWRVLARGPDLSLLELELETGRKHQIRVQLADSGHAVVGDERYGTLRARGKRPVIEPGRLCLHACMIELRLPGREILRIESPPPPEFEAAVSSTWQEAWSPEPTSRRPRGGPSIRGRRR